jgi:hypothetical protein
MSDIMAMIRQDPLHVAALGLHAAVSALLQVAIQDPEATALVVQAEVLLRKVALYTQRRHEQAG